MSSLINTKIQDTYTGLIKTADNAPITGTLKNLEDGNGGVLPIQISTAGVNFTGTVTGITAGGLSAGAGTDSMVSVLTSVPATAPGTNNIAIGQGSDTGAVGNDIAITIDGAATGGFSNAFGIYTEATGNYSNAFGSLCNASATNALAVGKQASASATASIAIGAEPSVTSGSDSSIAIGNLANVDAGFGGKAIAIGYNVKAKRDGGVNIGKDLNTTIGNLDHFRPITIGSGSYVQGGDSIGIGSNVVVSGTGTNNKIAIGNGANVSGESAIGVGSSVTAPNEGDVNIGDGNSIASKSILPGDVVIGQGNNSSTVNGGENVLIGKNNTVTQNERNAAIGYGNSISRGAHYILGSQNTTSSQYQIGIVGNSNTASGEKSFIGGHGCSATAKGAVALGDSVTASTAQTVTIKRLQMLDYASLDFADDTAAATGGIPLGGVYHTSGTLKIRIA